MTSFGRQAADEVRRSALLHLMNMGVEIAQMQEEPLQSRASD
jgi:hypothetical protein